MLVTKLLTSSKMVVKTLVFAISKLLWNQHSFQELAFCYTYCLLPAKKMSPLGDIKMSLSSF